MTYDPRVTSLNMIAGLKENDEDAWREFYQFYTGLIKHVATNEGCPEPFLDDVVQSVALSIQKAIQKYDNSKSKFRTYLNTIIKRRAVDILRKNSIPMTHDKPDESPVKAEDTKDDLLWLELMLETAIRRVLKETEHRTYKSICSYIFDGQSADLVADKLNISKDAVFQHKSRFLKAVYIHFSDELKHIPDLTHDLSDNEKQKLFMNIVKEKASGTQGYRLTQYVSQDPKRLVDRLVFVQTTLDAAAKSSFSPALYYVQNRVWKQIKNVATIGCSDCDMISTEASVSQLHATITQSDKVVSVKDEFSTNGTYVNDVKVTDPKKLNHGDIIRLGKDALFIFVE